MNYKLKDLNFELDLSKTNYQVDAIQHGIIQTYIRGDTKFRRAYHTNFTPYFVQFIKDKAKLREPVHLSIIGNTRSGKSYSAIAVCCLGMACYGKIFDERYICGNVFEFLEKLKTMPEEDLKNSYFLIDEEKKAIYGIGSTAKKMKVLDVQNIIAINNISTIMLTPISWANENAFYGLKTFGRCFNTGSVRLMLYNLQSNKGQEPLGMVYLPIFTKFLPKKDAEELESIYLKKKNDWVKSEMRGEGDVLYELKVKTARVIARDKKFIKLKKRGQKKAYISFKLGSEYTKTECDEVLNLINLINEGVI